MPHENLEIVRRWWQAFNETGSAPLELCDEGIEIRNPPEFPVTGPYFGHDGVRQWESDAWDVFRELRMEVDEIIDAGDGMRVVSVQTVRGRMRHSDLPSDVQWASVLTLSAGRVVRAEGYLTKAQALDAVGAEV